MEKKDKATGWKCFDAELKCRGHQFEVGKSYKVQGELAMCANGFHFHENPAHLFNYYSSRDSRVCEVVAYEVLTGDDKSCCRKIEVGREVPFLEAASLVGNGYGYGNGNGYGDGDGYGYGYGNGYGYGYGNGYGYGDGNGDGYGDGYGKIETIFYYIKGAAA